MRKTDKKYDIFISYRRAGGDLSAKIIRDHLIERGYSVFFDVESLKSGNFNNRLYDVIDNCNDFVIILSPGVLERCQNENDWVRKELAHALAKGKNIVPIMLTGFTMPSEGSPEANALPADIRDIIYMHGIVADSQTFASKMEDLENKFLKSRPRTVIPTNVIFKRVIPVLTAMLLVAAIGLGVFFASGRERVFPKTSEEKNVVDEVMYYVGMNLTLYDQMNNYALNAFNSAKNYALSDGSIDFESLNNEFSDAVNQISQLDIGKYTVPDALVNRINALSKTPISSVEFVAMCDSVSTARDSLLKQLDYVFEVVGPYSTTAKLDRVKLVESYISLLQEDVKNYGYATNETLVNITNKEALDSFFKDILPQMRLISLSASTWKTDTEALRIDQNTCFERIEKTLFDMALIHVTFVDASMEEQDSMSDTLRNVLTNYYFQQGYPYSEAKVLAEIESKLKVDWKPKEGDSYNTLWLHLTATVSFRDYPSARDTNKELLAAFRKVAVDDGVDPNAVYYYPALERFCEQVFDGGIDYGVMVMAYEYDDLPNELINIGDIIVAINGGPCINYDEYARMKDAVTENEFELTVLRLNGDDLEELKITLTKDMPKFYLNNLTTKIAS